MANQRSMAREQRRGSCRMWSLVGCNVIHMLVGLVCLGISFGQMVENASVQLDNPYWDLRALNSIHLITGVVGLFMVVKSYGSIAAESLFCISIAIGAITVAFYADLALTMISQYTSVSMIPGQELIYHRPDFILTVFLAACGGLQVINGIVSNVLLGKLSGAPSLIVAGRAVKVQSRMCYVSVLKILLALVVLGVGSYLEYSKKQVYIYLRTTLHHLSGAVLLVSAIMDAVIASYKQGRILNAKVGLTLSIASAVLCIKCVDYLTVRSQLPEDIAAYNDITALGADAALYQQRLILRAVEIAALLLGFLVSTTTAVHHGGWMEKLHHYEQWNGPKEKPQINSYLDSQLRRQRCCLGAVQIVCGLALVVLFILTHLPWAVSKEFDGSRLLWVGCLLIMAGLATSAELLTFATAVFITSILGALVALEYAIYAAVSVSAQTHRFKETGAKTGLLLSSIQLGVLGGACLFSFIAAFHFSRTIAKLPAAFKTTSTSRCALAAFSLVHALYGILVLGVAVAARVLREADTSFPIPEFVDSTNGLIAIGTAIIQLRACSRSHLVPSTAVLNTVCATISLHVIAPCCSDLYTLIYNQAAAAEPADPRVIRAFDLSVALTAAVLAGALVDYTAACISAMIHCHTLHHSFAPSQSQGTHTTNSHAFTLPLPGQYGGASRHSSRLLLVPPSNSSHSAGDGKQRYFGSDFRTYAQANNSNNNNNMHNRFNNATDTRKSEPPASNFAPESRISSYTQTNVRHMFDYPKVDDYLNGY